MDAKLIAKNLEMLLGREKFRQFYKGDFLSDMSGDFAKGTPEHKACRERVENKLKEFAQALISN